MHINGKIFPKRNYTCSRMKTSMNKWKNLKLMNLTVKTNNNCSRSPPMVGAQYFQDPKSVSVHHQASCTRANVFHKAHQKHAEGRNLWWKQQVLPTKCWSWSCVEVDTRNHSQKGDYVQVSPTCKKKHASMICSRNLDRLHPYSSNISLSWNLYSWI